MSPELTGAQKSHLRGLAQTLEPKVFVGKEGITPAILKLLEDAFRRADLVKALYAEPPGPGVIEA